jgi:hypothetical protein
MTKGTSLISSPRLCKLLKQAAKTVVCLLLCVSLVWGYSYKEPTEAHATAAVAGVVIGAAAVAAAAIALGIAVNGAVNNETYAQSCQRIWDKLDEGIKRKITCAELAGACVYNLTSEFLTSVGNQMTTAYNSAMAFEAMTNIPVALRSNDNYNQYFANLSKTFGWNTDFQEGSSTFNDSYRTVLKYRIIDTIPCPADGVIATISAPGLTNTFMRWSKGGWTSSSGWEISHDGVDYSSVGYENKQAVLGYLIGVVYANATSTIYYYLVSGERSYGSYGNLITVGMDGTGALTIPANPGHDVYGIPAEDVYSDGYSALNHPVSDVVGKVGDAVGQKTIDGSLNIPVSIPENKVDTKTQTQTQDKVLNKDIADTASKEANDKTNKGKNTAPPKLPDLPDLSLPSLITKKFPFSLPWDLYLAFSNLVAPAKAPKFVYPIKLKRLGIDQSITIDFANYEKLAAISRWGFALAFIVWLILITRKMIGQGG